MKWRDPETLNIYEHYYDEQKFRELHEKLQENYSQREKEYFKSLKAREKLTKPVQPIHINLDSSDLKDDWVHDFFEGME